MSIFSRARDIVSANINAILDNAEDPEKLVTMMVREMEDTLIELKASCAGAMAAQQRMLTEKRAYVQRVEEWYGKARRAVELGRDDLAREALLEKRRYAERVEALEEEISECGSVVEQYQREIAELKDKLEAVKEKRRVLVERHTHALNKKRAQLQIRRVDTSPALARAEAFRQRIGQLEAEAGLVNPPRGSSLAEEIGRLQTDEALEEELERLKAPYSR